MVRQANDSTVEHVEVWHEHAGNAKAISTVMPKCRVRLYKLVSVLLFVTTFYSSLAESAEYDVREYNSYGNSWITGKIGDIQWSFMTQDNSAWLAYWAHPWINVTVYPVRINSGYAPDSVEGDIEIPSSIGGYPVVGIGAPVMDNSYVGTFSYYSKLTSITIPNTVKYIGPYAFMGCSSLKAISIPASVTNTVLSGVFEGCSNLESLTILSPHVESFQVSSDKLKTLVFPNNVKDISVSASQCNIEIPHSVTNLDLGNIKELIIPRDPQFDLYSAFKYCRSVERVTIPQEVCSIGMSRIFNYSYQQPTVGKIMQILVDDEVTNICDSAFSGCSSMTNIVMPASVRTIGAGAFSGCHSLPAIELPPGIKSLNDGIFSGCYSLSEVSIPYGVTNIGKSAFSYCTNLVELTIPDSVKVIETSAFSLCTSLKKIKLPAHLERIEGSAFSGCTALSEIDLPESVISIGAGAFSGCTALTEISLPRNVNQIGDSAFQGCRSLESVSIAGNVEKIGNSTFYDCTSLAELELPDSISEIGSYAFYGCNSLIDLRYPDGLLAIGSYAFCNCSNLVNVIFDDRIEQIGQYAFQNCTSLKEVEIPCSVTNLSSSFYQCSGLTNAVLHKGLLSISDFSGCSSLSSIKLPGSVNTLGGFSNCDALRCVVVPPSVTNLHWYSFYTCPNLQTAWVPTNLESQVVERYVFNNCPSDFKIKYYNPAEEEMVITGNGQGVAVPKNWLGQYPGKSVLDMSANGRCRFYECYVLGIDPANATNDFRIVSFAMKPDGTIDLDSIVFDPPQTKWNVLDAKPVLKGATNLDGDWMPVPIGGAGDFRFFKVDVELQ